MSMILYIKNTRRNSTSSLSSKHYLNQSQCACFITAAELILRRLAQSYQEHITTNYLSKEGIEAAGENAADFIYGLIKNGELKQLDGQPLEIKMNYLIQRVQKEAAEQKQGFFRKVAVFEEPVVVEQLKKVHAFEGDKLRDYNSQYTSLQVL